MNFLRRYWKILGPGLTTGAADDDPSGIATYSQVGAARGFGLIWLSLFSAPLMGVVNEMCARIGIVSGVGLASNIKKYYSKKVLYFCTFLLIFANTFNIGADLGAMGKATQLLFPQASFTILVIFFAVFSTLLQVFIPYKEYSKYLKYLVLVLFTYILSALSVKINWTEVLYNTLIPAIDFSRNALKNEIILICAVLGTTISPYLFFWQTSQEVEDRIAGRDDMEKLHQEHTTHQDIKNMRVDVWSGVFISNLVMFFIIAVCGAVLFANGIRDITSAEQAALALRPFAGNFSYFLFTLGIVGTGLLAIPILAGSASYAVSESFGWKEGLSQKFVEARAFYGVIILAVFFGIILNFIGLDPIKTLIYSAVFNGLIAPVMIFFILRISSNENIMGEFKNKKFTSFFGWLTFILMSLVAILTIVFLLL